MGLFKALVDFAVDAAGETHRRSVAAKQEETMSAEDRELVKRAIQMAESGNIQAMKALGDSYALGQKVGYNPEEAVKWLTMAAQRGDVDSMKKLGILYSGSDVTRTVYDANLAGYWFNEAAQRGDPDSIRMMKKYRFNTRKQKWQQID